MTFSYTERVFDLTAGTFYSDDSGPMRTDRSHSSKPSHSSEAKSL